MTDDQQAILAILAGQSPGYDAFPNASCFAAAGYKDADLVAQVLSQLADLGLTQQYVYDVVDEAALASQVEASAPVKDGPVADVPVPDPGPPLPMVEVPGGFEITDSGRKLVAEYEGGGGGA